MDPIRRILVATDFSPCSDAAAALAARLVTPLGAAVELLTVIDTSAISDASGDPEWRKQRIARMHHAARARLHEVAEQVFGAGGVAHLHVLDGGLEPPAPATEIARLAESRHCDLIVLGTHGKTGLARLVLGSVAEAVVRSSRVPVLTVRAPQPETGRAV